MVGIEGIILERSGDFLELTDVAGAQGVLGSLEVLSLRFKRVGLGRQRKQQQAGNEEIFWYRICQQIVSIKYKNALMLPPKRLLSANQYFTS